MTQILQTKRYIHDGDFQPNQNQIDNANQTAVPTNPESSITPVRYRELLVESMMRRLVDTGQISGLEQGNGDRSNSVRHGCIVGLKSMVCFF